MYERSSVVEQRPFKPFGAPCPKLPELAKSCHFIEMLKIRLATRSRKSPEIDNPSATSSDTRKSASNIHSGQYGWITRLRREQMRGGERFRKFKSGFRNRKRSAPISSESSQ